jgi:uncharacterized repeat protein (TIGR04052 family)
MHLVHHASIHALSLCLSTVAIPVIAVAQSEDATMPVRIAVLARVGRAPFACGKAYKGIGTTKSTIEGTEFMFYVHDVRLITRDGREVAVQLKQDSLWQSEGVSLLDFEDGTAGCTNGNADLHGAIEGTIAQGDYSGVRFTLGVPFDRNHKDLTTQPSPLSLTRMFWAWNSGYKFLRLDLKTNGVQTWMVHLGSTECTPSGVATIVPTACRWENRPTVSLDGFNPARDAIVFDVAELLRGADVSHNQPKTASGCMSSQTDRDCTPLFVALGLPHAGTPAGSQHVFRIEHGGAAAAGGAEAARQP